MAVEENADTAAAASWDAEECMVASNEQLALTRFASRLGSFVGKDEPGIVDAGDVRQEAELLMCLLSPQSSSKLFYPDNEDLSALTALSEMSCSSSTTTSEFRLQPRRRREGFAFSCPSLSLDTTCVANTMLEPCVTTSSSSSSAVKKERDRDSVSPTPGVLFSRPLRVDDRDALRLSAEAMARNLLLSYRKALEWRIQAWVNTLSTVLLRSEQELIKKEASKEDIEKLLETSEAQLIVKLQQVGQRIDVLDARTSFEVLARRILPSDQTSPSPSNKKQRLEDDTMPSAFRTETEYKYTVSHVLSMDCVLNLLTPAGYSEVALNVPGVITGTFLSTEPGVEELTAVNVELETNILASMVEKSCRIVVRSSVEAVAEEGDDVQVNDNVDEQMTDICLPDLKRNDSPSAEMASPPEAAIVTPRYPSPPSLYLDADMEGKASLLSIPDEFKQTSRRLVSPQPKSPELNGFAEFTPRTPQPMETEMSVPSLVSPPLTTSSIEYAEIQSRGGPSLPALVEAACAAMKEA